MAILLHIWNHLQRQLFPILTEEIGDLTDTDRHFVSVMALVPLGALLEPYRWQGEGRPPEERVTASLARDICQRQGGKAILAGSIASLGANYAIVLDAQNCQTGESLARE